MLSLLAIVREYALGRLKERGDADHMRAAHADYYTALVRRDAGELRSASQASTLAALSIELANLRAAVRHLIYTDRLDDAADFAWSLLIYWWIMGLFGGVRVWMLELLGKEQPIRPHSRAVAWFYALWGEMWQHPSEEVVAGLAECVRLFTESGDEDAAAMALAARATARVQLPRPDIETASRELDDAVERLHRLGNGWGEAITRVSLGRVAWLRGEPEAALAHFRRASEVAESGGDLFTRSVAGNQIGRLLLVGGKTSEAEDFFRRTLVDSITLHHDEGVAYGLEGMCAIAAAHGDAHRAGALSAAAASIRHRIGVFDVEAFTVHEISLDAVRQAQPDAVADGERTGAELSVAEAVALALPDADASVAHAVAHW